MTLTKISFFMIMCELHGTQGIENMMEEVYPENELTSILARLEFY